MSDDRDDQVNKFDNPCCQKCGEYSLDVTICETSYFIDLRLCFDCFANYVLEYEKSNIRKEQIRTMAEIDVCKKQLKSRAQHIARDKIGKEFVDLRCRQGELQKLHHQWLVGWLQDKDVRQLDLPATE